MENPSRWTAARYFVQLLSLTLKPILPFQGIRNFIIAITVKVASDEVTLRKEKTYINKLNLALVQVCTYVNGSEVLQDQ
jgi:hypothetical protein